MFAIPAWLWVVFTLGASSAQTARNAMQRDLVGTVGAQGATYVRFLFGLPFAVLFLVLARALVGLPLPIPGSAALVWIFVGATTQIAATALMLTAMRERSFLVTIAYTKTEPVLVALFSIVVLGEHPTWTTALAIALATAGVLAMSLPRGDGAAHSWRPALIGLGSGAFFGLSAISFRVGLLALGSPSFVLAATTTLVLGLAIQCALILGWLLARDRALLRAILANWRRSLFAGLMGAMASQMWFLAFAISTATKVRTLGLIEVPMAHVVTRRVFKQGMGPADLLGTALVAAGVLLLIRG